MSFWMVSKRKNQYSGLQTTFYSPQLDAIQGYAESVPYHKSLCKFLIAKSETSVPLNSISDILRVCVSSSSASYMPLGMPVVSLQQDSSQYLCDCFVVTKRATWPTQCLKLVYLSRPTLLAQDHLYKTQYYAFSF